jgi:type III secretory pathway component EscS
MIDSKQAAEALADIDDIVQRLRQSQLYELASLGALWWGALVFAGNLVTWLWPFYAMYAWPAVDILGVGGLVVIRLLTPAQAQAASFDLRIVLVFALFFAFGYICTDVLGHFGPRELGAFWPIYFMLFYTLAGLWFGYAFVAIGLGITALTLIGYFTIGATFPLWMAFVNGGGLILGGLWMRRI